MTFTLQKNIPLAPLTTLKVGGNAEYFAEISSEEELLEALAYAEREDLRVHILGGGSNALVGDDGVTGLVIRMRIEGMHVEKEGDTVFLTVGAGADLDATVAHTVANGWWGLENLSHIPGTVGATPVQNVGAYGIEAKDVIKEVRVFNRERRAFETLDAEACAFGYRDSIFKRSEGGKYVITSVTYRLSIVAMPKIAYRDLATLFADTTPSQTEIREAVMKIRAGKFPDWNEVGTAGSFFKNPVVSTAQYEALLASFPELPAFPSGEGFVKLPLGWILDKALNLRGYKNGNVGTYKDQALVIIAEKNATAQEIENFANDIISKIKNEIGIDVEWEVTKIK